MRGCLDVVLCAAAAAVVGVVVMGFAATSFEVEDVFVWKKSLEMSEEQRRSQHLELAID